MRKRGQMKELQTFIIYLIIAIIILAVLIFYIGKAGGKFAEEEALAKQISLLIDAAESGSTIIIEKDEDMVVSIEGSNIIVKSGDIGTGYSYDFFTKGSVIIEDNGKEVIIKIEK